MANGKDNFKTVGIKAVNKEAPAKIRLLDLTISYNPKQQGKKLRTFT